MIYRSAAIFGSSGGIGAALVAALADQGVRVRAGSRSARGPQDRGEERFTFDLEDDASIGRAVDGWRDDPPDLVIVATGVLTLSDGTGPERSFRQIDAAAMARVLQINTIGPAQIARHVLPLLPRDRPVCFAALSARVGSISDNRLGGWHSYRASKAALNMLIANFAIEMRRTHELARIVGLHPGTVDTALSQPFQKNLPQGQLASAADAAGKLLQVIEHLAPEDSGKVFDYAGKRVPA